MSRGKAAITVAGITVAGGLGWFGLVQPQLQQQRIDEACKTILVLDRDALMADPKWLETVGFGGALQGMPFVDPDAPPPKSRFGAEPVEPWEHDYTLSRQEVKAVQMAEAFCVKRILPNQ